MYGFAFENWVACVKGLPRRARGYLHMWVIVKHVLALVREEDVFGQGSMSSP